MTLSHRERSNARSPTQTRRRHVGGRTPCASSTIPGPAGDSTEEDAPPRPPVRGGSPGSSRRRRSARTPSSPGREHLPCRPRQVFGLDVARRTSRDRSVHPTGPERARTTTAAVHRSGRRARRERPASRAPSALSASRMMPDSTPGVSRPVITSTSLAATGCLASFHPGTLDRPARGNDRHGGDAQEGAVSGISRSPPAEGSAPA